MIGDLWSSAVLLPDMAALYREEVTGHPANLKPIGSTFAEYVDRERQWLAGPRGEASWEYWRGILDGRLAPLELPTDRPRPAILTERGARHSFSLDRGIVDRLTASAVGHGGAVPTLLLAGLQTLLHRYTGQDDIVTGFLKAGRSASTARVFGYFVNPVLIRNQFTGGPSFRRVLSHTQRAVEECAGHDWYPFPLLVSRLKPARDLSRTPLFQVMFSWQKTSRLAPGEHAAAFALDQTGRRADLGELRMRPVPIPQRTSFFDLSLSAGEVADGLALTFEYNSDLFDASTVERIARCYRTLLESASVDPDHPVSQLDILTNRDRRQLLVEWNATAAPYPRRCLHRLFEEQARRLPDGVALEFEGQTLTYRDLNRRANQLAYHLMQLGTSPGSFVGLCCEPSLQTVIGALGILKAGAAYLPIDPHYPRERQAFMLSDVQASTLITHTAVRDRLPAFEGTILDLEADGPAIARQSDNDPPPRGNPDDPAYAIFTSGSTGQPKGSALAHRGVVNLLNDLQRRQPIAPGDPCSWWTSVSFDVSVYEIFSALLAGGALHVIPHAMRLDLPALLDWLSVHHIRHAYLPPFMLADLARWVQENPNQSDLRRLLVGVEPISEELLINISARVPGLRIINGYGPSETTICSTLYDVNGARPGRGKTPIGKPVLNTRIYVLDSHLQPVPAGVTGEIYVGGDGLAQGYLHRPELTRERFVPDPFSGRPGARLYRTGDLARHLPDGNLEFLGRRDDQVKVNGVRIEPAEIEIALTTHPAIRSAAVLTQQDQAGHQRLVAYVLPAATPPPSPRDLRLYLARRLPEYMLPHAFVALDSLPRTPSGKLDRRSLPVPGALAGRESRAGPAARTRTEKTLASIWERVLGSTAVGLNDNFFELGGDSIMAMQVVSQAARAGLRLSPKDVFQAPTVAGLAALADEAGPSQAKAEGRNMAGEFPLTPIQEWFFAQSFAHPNHWNQALMFVTAKDITPVHLRSAVAAVVARHDALRLRFAKGPAGWRQAYAGTGEEVPFETFDLSGLPEEQRVTAVEERAAEFQRSLDISRGPLIRVAFFDVGAGLPGRLLIVIHHLAVDAVSWRVLLEDLQAAHAQVGRGEAIRLPPKTTSYRHWAEHLTDVARSPGLQSESGLWLREAARERSLLPLDPPPAESAAVSNTEEDARTCSTSLGQDETRDLLRLGATARGTRIEAILLTSLARAFQRWTGSRMLRVDVEAHGREELSGGVDLSRSVGWFTAICPAGLELPAADEPGDQLTAMEAQLNSARRHGLHYNVLRYLSQDPHVRHQAESVPQSQVCFNFLGHIRFQADGDLIGGLAPESAGPLRHPENRRPYLIEITSAVIDGKLQTDWTYNARIHRPETIGRVTRFFTDELQRLKACLASNVAPELIAADPVPGRATIDGADAASEFPVSPMQQGMLFHSREAPESGVYVQQIVSTIEGPLDIRAFSEAWKRLVERHAVLRTAFIGEPLDRIHQVVCGEVGLPLDVQDWLSVPPQEQEARFETLLADERRHGFDVARAPLWRLTLIRTASEVRRCVFSHHHALLDGWSLALLFGELFTLYEGCLRNVPVTLPDARPYSDYIAWLASRDRAAAEAFWREALAGCPLGSWLPVDCTSAPSTAPARPAERRTHLSLHETSALQTAARDQHLTLGTLVQGAWALLLARRSRRNEVVFGTTVAGRPADLAGHESMVGLFINTIPVRVRFDPAALLAEWLERLQRQAAEAREHADFPLARIQALSGARPGRPLFDSVLVFENYPIDGWLPKGQAGIRITDVRAIEQTNYPLAIAVVPGQRLLLKVGFDPSRMEPLAVEELLQELRDLLARMISHPNGTLAEVGRLTDGDIVQGPAPGGPPTSPPRAYVAPRGPLQIHLARLWGEVLRIERVGAHDDFFDLGGNSLIGAVLVSRIRRELGAELPLGVFFDAPTIAELAGHLEKDPSVRAGRLGTSPPPTASRRDTAPATRRLPSALVPIQTGGTRVPLFCVHPAGGVVFPYYALARHLAKDQPLFGLQDPSLFDGDGRFRSIEDMAAHYLDALRGVQPSGPYNLLGWSVGGVIAFEIAQQLSRQGERVASLVILDTAAPAGPGHRSLDGRRLPSTIRRMVDQIRMAGSAMLPIASYVRSGLFLKAATAGGEAAAAADKPKIADLLRWALLDTWRKRLLQKAEVASAVPAESSLRLVEMPDVRRVLQMVQHHIRLARRYAVRNYPGSVTVFRAGPPHKEGRHTDPSLGWADLAEGGVRVRTVRANHVALMVHPYVGMLAKELAEHLDAAPQGDKIR
ncbi:MAG TPA: amino acid adenylation domain-containing protein [Anaerolineales bacterium]|nr:amino acid adenylation domain-containing protein [Anaerolineales bacterium]